MEATFGHKPSIVYRDDISDIHNEVGWTDAEGVEHRYDHTIRVVFREPFANIPPVEKILEQEKDPDKAEMIWTREWDRIVDSPEYTAAREAYESAAILYVNQEDEYPLETLKGSLMDWRDEEELWMRFND